MRKPLTFGLIVISALFARTYALDGKTIGHLITIPLIEGAGIYSSIRVMQNGETNAMAASVTNLALIATNAGVGAYTLFFKPENYEKPRTLHRILGFTVSAASIWLSITAATDDDINGLDKGISAGYTAMTVVPLLLFSF